ncbi:MAG: hypothetical protein AB7Q01_05640, partial [Gammaproteobacteria bacterium]
VMERIAHEIAYLDRVTALNERLARLAAPGAEDVRDALAGAWRQRASFSWGPDLARPDLGADAPAAVRRAV